ncbi:hypothetical protein [Larkinella harenae]
MTRTIWTDSHHRGQVGEVPKAGSGSVEQLQKAGDKFVNETAID